MQATIEKMGIGSSVPGFNLGQLRSLRFQLPELPEQARIAQALAAFDTKIEHNQRTARALEKLARATFRAWFVDFEPVKAKAAGAKGFPSMTQEVFELLASRLTEQDGAPLPEGWRFAALGEISQPRREQLKPSETEADTPYFGLEHMPRRSIALNDWGLASEISSNKTRFEKGDVLFGKLRPYFHKVGVAPVAGVCSTDILAIRASSSEWFGLVLGHLMSDDFVFYTTAASTGTKMPRTNWGDMARYAIALPPRDLAVSFGQLVSSLIESIIQGIFQSRMLAATRDYLLPKLLSGEVRVEAAEELAREGG